MFLEKIILLSCLICIFGIQSSLVNGAPASSIRNVYEDSGGGSIDHTITSKSSLLKTKRDVKNVGIEISHENSPQEHHISHKSFQSSYRHPIQDPEHEVSSSWNKNEPFHKMPGANLKRGAALSRTKREGFFDMSELPRMMAHMARGLDLGLGSMLHSMMHAGHQMASHFMPVRPPPPTIHNVHSDNGHLITSGASAATGSGSYKTQNPQITYGEWVPIGTFSKQKPRPPKPNNGYQPSINNHISTVTVEKPNPIFASNPKPTFTRPHPVYPRPPPARPAPSFSRPTSQYRPVAFPKPSLRPTVTSIVDPNYASPKPQKEEDSYGTPIGQPVGPVPSSLPSQQSPSSSISNQYQPSVNVQENPFTQPPYQTTFTPQKPQTGSPLSGAFVGSGETNHGHVEAVHAVEEWSDDTKHIKPIVDNTLYYNDLLQIKFKKKHDDGRKPEHSGLKAKEHHRIEKSAHPHGHEIGSPDPFSASPSFQSFPPLSGAFQVHHLPPVPPVGRKKYRKRKAGPIFQRARSPDSIFNKLFS